MRVFVHVLGESDLGYDSNRRNRASRAGETDDEATFADAVGRLEAALAAAADTSLPGPERAGHLAAARTLLTTAARTTDPGRQWQEVPLAKLLRGFGPGDRLLLVATRTGDERDTHRLAAAIRLALVLAPSLYSTGNDQVVVGAGAVGELLVTEPPGARAGRETMRDWLRARDGQVHAVVTGIGSGPKGLVLGALMAVLASGLPSVTVRPIQESDHDAVDLQVASDVAPWLARRRMFGALATHVVADAFPETRGLLRFLDARQRLDPERFTAAASALAAPVPASLGLDQHAALANAMADRLARQEVQASLVCRAWLVSLYRSLRVDGDPDVGERETLGAFIGRVQREAGWRAHTSGAVALALSPEFGFLQEFASRGPMHGLRPPTAAFARAVAALAPHLDRDDPRRDPAAGLGALKGLPGVPDLFRWSSLPSGRVLLAYCVGEAEAQGDHRPIADALCAPDLPARLAALVDGRSVSRGGRERLVHEVRQIATAQTMPKAQASARYLAARLPGPGGEAPGAWDPPEPVLVDLVISDVREKAREAFLRSAGIDDIEAVVVCVGPGANAMNAGLLLAGTDVALGVGCPVYVGSLVEDRQPDGTRATRLDLDAAQVIALPGYPGLLATLALEHLAELEVTAAADTLRRGGDRLAEVTRAAERLRDGLVRGARGAAGPAEAARRIELVRTLATGTHRDQATALAETDTWHALHLAMAVGDAVLGAGWYRAHGRFFCHVAYNLRSRALAAHGAAPDSPGGVPPRFADTLRDEIDAALRRSRANLRGRPKTCAQLLADVRRELLRGTPPDPRPSLLDQYETLVRDLRAIAGPGRGENA